MTASTDDEIASTKPNGQPAGQLRGFNGHASTGSQRYDLSDQHQQHGMAPPPNELMESTTRSRSQYLPSPSNSGDETDNAPSERAYGWRRQDIFSTPQGKTINEAQKEGELFRTNGIGLHQSAKIDFKPALLTQSDGTNETVITLREENDGQKWIRKLSSAKMYELTTSPKSLPLYSNPLSGNVQQEVATAGAGHDAETNSIQVCYGNEGTHGAINGGYREEGANESHGSTLKDDKDGLGATSQAQDSSETSRPRLTSHTYSTPGLGKRRSSQFHTPKPSAGFQGNGHFRSTPTPLPLGKNISVSKGAGRDLSVPSPMPSSGLPTLPLSLSTYLQLELSLDPQSRRLIHRSAASDIPYESSAVKVERLLNFLLLPPQLEQVLWFGALACLDAWLYSFTILPLRFVQALFVLVQSWSANLVKEIKFVGGFIYSGTGRMWHRRRRASSATSGNLVDAAQAQGSASPRAPQNDTRKKDAVLHPREEQSDNISNPHPQPKRRRRGSATYKRHHRTKSTPSALTADHKADLLKGLLILISCAILMYLDASRMYHGIRGQAAIKLYVIYNVLEVECLVCSSVDWI